MRLTRGGLAANPNPPDHEFFPAAPLECRRPFAALGGSTFRIALEEN
jgi:hypothetical protein